MAMRIGAAMSGLRQCDTEMGTRHTLRVDGQPAAELDHTGSDRPGWIGVAPDADPIVVDRHHELACLGPHDDVSRSRMGMAPYVASTLEHDVEYVLHARRRS